ncbi:MAG: GH3 auxin-responsive promoter family protein [Candidatus Bathyarchaeota archaeon]|nr:GH3 auxin-responsive promoter family protein [Candidatus Bathyarchaeota archaeon]
MFQSGSSEKFLQAFVKPWYEALQNPKEAQEKTLQSLLEHYKKTDYGAKYQADKLENIKDFQLNFPKVNYHNLKPLLEQTKKGNYQAFLSEEPICWVMTRGSTGVSKILPVTKTHLDQILYCGARALINFILRRKDPSMLTGKILNLNFPSTVAEMEANGKKVMYGYSSGTYAKLNPMLNQLALVPKQEDIDSTGSGIARADWDRRFELVYQKALGQEVNAAMGVTPVIMSFARYISRTHGKRPKNLWSLKALFCTSVRKIQFKYAPKLKSYYGEIPVVEMYSATEGVFGQQLDNLPYISPNYDTYLFEVETGKGVKMLHDLERGEWGRLIISSCLLPRYDIGDMVEAMGKGYFRVFGRATRLTLLEHRLYRLLFRWFV